MFQLPVFFFVVVVVAKLLYLLAPPLPLQEQSLRAI